MKDAKPVRVQYIASCGHWARRYVYFYSNETISDKFAFVNDKLVKRPCMECMKEMTKLNNQLADGMEQQ